MSFAVQKTRYDINVKVRFDVNGGDYISETEKTYVLGQKYESFPVVTKGGYIFSGWFTQSEGGTKITTDSKVDYNITKLYAHYVLLTNYTSFEITTTSSYKKFGIYSTTLKSGSTSQFIDWGDGVIEEVTGNISQKTHEYANVGTYIVKVSDDITSIAPSTNNYDWCESTSQVYYTLKKILHFSTSLTSIPAYGYYYCYNLTSISGISDSNITSLPTYCFHNCYYLSSLNGLSKITSIGDYCFGCCQNLTSFTGLGNITSLPSYSFYSCSRITSLATLPTSVTTYNQYCLGQTGISDLSRIRTTDMLNWYCFGSMHQLRNLSTLAPRSSLPRDCFQNCSNLNVVDFTNWNSLTAIPYYCFYQNTGLTSIVFNQNLKMIDGYAFYYCNASNFRNLNLKDTQLTSIGSHAFDYDHNLTSISLPSTLTSINDYAFAGCSNVQQISCYASNAPTTYANTFGNTDGTGTYAYVGNAYKSTGNNQLHVENPDNYNTSYWQSVLLDSSKCGFNIIPFDEYDIRGCKVEGLSAKYEYTGSPIVPDITVKKQDGTALTKDTDYDVQLADNTELGTASLSVIGINNYHHNIVKTFKIYDPSAQSIEVDLNDQWRVATTKTNPDPTNYDLYESNSNYNVRNAFAKMYVRTTNVDDLDLYINSYAESNFDYTVIFNKDVDCTSLPSQGTANVLTSTYGFQMIGTDINSDFKKASYQLGGDEHFITICYRKDGSVNNGYDRGYVLVPKVKDPKNLANARMEGLSSWYLSTGYEIVPEVSVYSSNGTLLTENVEWSKVLSNNINVGTAGISAVGISPYCGCLAKTFKIVGEAPKMTELEYIQGNGSVINTGYTPTLNTKLEFKCNFENYTGDVIVGHGGNESTQYDNNDFRLFNYGSATNLYWDYGYQRLNRTLSFTPTNFHTLTCYNGGFIFDGTTYSYSTTSYSVNGAKIKLFGFYNTSTGVNIKFSYLKIYESNVLQMDLVAAKDTSGIPCMYDKISEQFFYSTNSYTPIAGPEKTT